MNGTRVSPVVLQHIEKLRRAATLVSEEQGPIEALRAVVEASFDVEYVPSCGFPENEVREAQHKIAALNQVEQRIARLEDDLELVQADLRSMRKPLLLAKRRYEEDRRETEDRILHLEGLLKCERDSCAGMIATMGNACDMLEAAKTQSQLDSEEYRRQKHELVSCLCDEACRPPDSVFNLDWESAEDWLVDFIRTDPVNKLLPYALPFLAERLLSVARFLMACSDRWIESSAAVIIEGQECPLGGVKGLYWELVDQLVRVGKPYLSEAALYWDLRAWYYLLLAIAAIPEEILEAVEKGNAWSGLAGIEEAAEPTLQMLEALNIGRRIALRDKDETSLNAIRVTEKKKCECFGDLKLSVFETHVRCHRDASLKRERSGARAHGESGQSAALSDSKRPETIRNALLAFAKRSDFFVAPSIPGHRLANACESCDVPPDEIIVGLADLTVLGSATLAVVIGTKGIYYRNDWSSRQPGPHTLSYDVLKQRDIDLEGWLLPEVRLGGSGFINVSGSDLTADTMRAILKRVIEVV